MSSVFSESGMGSWRVGSGITRVAAGSGWGRVTSGRGVGAEGPLVGGRVVKSNVLAAPEHRGRRPVANVRTSNWTQHPRGKTAFT